jgi:hypothetical protein
MEKNKSATFREMPSMVFDDTNANSEMGLNSMSPMLNTDQTQTIQQFPILPIVCHE